MAAAKQEAAKEKAERRHQHPLRRVGLADVAKAEYDVNVDANRKVPGSRAPGRAEQAAAEVQRRPSLAIDKAKLDMRVAGHEAERRQGRGRRRRRKTSAAARSARP